MGRRLFFSNKDEIAKEKRREQLRKSGYVFGAHANEDCKREKDKRIPKTKRTYRQYLKLWMDFVEQYGIEGYKMGPGCATPDHTLFKEFLRWVFGGFEEIMEVKIPKEDRIEIFNWIRRTLTDNEKTIENVEIPDHSFTKKDFLRVLSSMWQADHRRFMPGLLKAIIMLALQLYLFTGARIGAFIPAHEDKDERGLRYKHIDLVLFPSSSAPWKVEWKVNQVWLKNNRNPEYTVFGIGIRDTKRPQFAAGYVLLAIALQHGALFGIRTVEDLAKYDLSSGRPIELRWKDEYLEKPVLRNVTAEGPQDVPLHKERFCELLRGIVTTAGYSKAVTVHKIRKYLGSVIEVSAVLGEGEQSNHIEYFQGFERFYERGFPGELPAEIEANILQKPEILDIKSRIEQLESQNADKESINAERLNYKKTVIRHRLFELKEYQTRWVRERRDQRILNRGKEEPLMLENEVCTRAQALVMPELSRIATLMSSNVLGTLTWFIFLAKVLFKDSAPQDAAKKKLQESNVRFCYQCMKWFTSRQWRDHCDAHLQSWDSQYCEVITYRHTVIRPGYCPFCLWNVELHAEDRLDFWLNSGNLRQHIEEQHMRGIQWSTTKPACGCAQTFDNERGLRHHLHDAHGLNKAIWLNPKPPRKRKRHCKAEARNSSTEEQDERPRKIRFYHFPPPRLHHEYQLSNHIFVPVPALLSFVEEHPEQYYCPDVTDKTSTGSRSNSVTTCFSAVNSPLNSRLTPPGLEVIDPKILEPLVFDEAKGQKSCEQVAVQLDSLTLSSTECDAKEMSSSRSTGPQSPVQDSASEQPADCAYDDQNEIEKTSQGDEHTSPSGSKVVTAEGRGANHFQIKAKRSRLNSPCDAQAYGTPSCESVTRVKSRERTRQQPNDSNPYNARKLNAKERRELLKLKGQNLTLRQIGSRFADIDTAVLRQAWLDLKPPQRCTRSRANRQERRVHAG
ncbi:hypothetical protein N7512_009450 [Penicillium capsulatum]|nr:hypothetical protein N7512_009450 [Penicillium capsulatum]